MTKKYFEYTLLVSAALFGFSLMSGAWAIDVDKLAETCANCHGKSGASTESDIPIISGYSAESIIGILTAYKNKERDCPETKYRAGSTGMCEMVKDLNDSDIKQIAQFFAKQKFVRYSGPIRQDRNPSSLSWRARPSRSCLALPHSC